MAVFNPSEFGAIALGSEGTLPQPDGNHLRWGFKTSLSFPEKGFLVYRREAVKGEMVCLGFSRRQVGQEFSGGFEIDGFRFDSNWPVTIDTHYPPSGTPKLHLPYVSPLRIDLPEAAMLVEISFV